jgi:hypothetical protein
VKRRDIEVGAARLLEKLEDIVSFVKILSENLSWIQFNRGNCHRSPSFPLSWTPPSLRLATIVEILLAMGPLKWSCRGREPAMILPVF